MISMNLGTEKVYIMTPKQKIKGSAGAKRRRRSLPKEYICIAPNDSQLVFDWLNGACDAANKEAAEVHLRLCFHCQEAVARLMRIDEQFRIKAGRCLHRNHQGNEESVRTTGVADAPELSQNEIDADHQNPSKSMKAGGKN